MQYTTQNVNPCVTVHAFKALQRSPCIIKHHEYIYVYMHIYSTRQETPIYFAELFHDFKFVLDAIISTIYKQMIVSDSRTRRVTQMLNKKMNDF